MPQLVDVSLLPQLLLSTTANVFSWLTPLDVCEQGKSPALLCPGPWLGHKWLTWIRALGKSFSNLLDEWLSSSGFTQTCYTNTNLFVFGVKGAHDNSGKWRDAPCSILDSADYLLLLFFLPRFPSLRKEVFLSRTCLVFFDLLSHGQEWSPAPSV